ncbi:zinc dependent phospholipase C family protein [Alkalithermobacter paradoxus]|uniref:Phospholipase C/D domain-containing protein n=1 Tax=Alkalithermobacter paradoxus TaxID=29349 RepID=A0A1V4I6I7_9FIRM|nr:hypothetical protein CLOTH_16670 [[Clostridium] thermoalcaliphilum]
MLMHTHKIIAYHVYDNIKNKLDIDLNRNCLIYGSMKPDISPRLALKKHYKNESFNFVLDEIMSLIDDGLSENLISINRFSTRLGVISHFLSDFFCLPHFDRDYYHDKLIKHLKYENDLHYKFKDFKGIDKIKIPYLEDVNSKCIRAFIEELYDTYKNKPIGFENDIHGSINISSAVGMVIVENSIMTLTEKVTA